MRRHALALIVGLALAAVAGGAAAQAPIGGAPAPPRPTQRVDPFPTLTPMPPGPNSTPLLLPANQPGTQQPGVALTPTPTWTLMPTWTPIPTPTITLTPTPSPYPTFVPAVTPTLAWPTPAPGAFFRSRFLASVPDPSISTQSGAGIIRGRVGDWRGIGLDRFRLLAVTEHGQLETATLGDGQYTFLNVAPGTYEISLPDYASEPAHGVPVLAGRATTVDWIESSRTEPALAPVLSPTVAAAPSATATPVPATLIQRPPSSPARPPPVEVVVLGIIARAAEQLFNAFLTGAAIVGVTAAITIALIRWRNSA